MAFLTWILIGVFVGLLGLWALRNSFAVITVEGQSMLPALKNGDRVLLWRHVPEHWLHHRQIVVLDIKGLETSARSLWEAPKRSAATFARQDVLYIKRLVALAGETYQATVPIPSGYCFVCGDNAAHSNDSRHWGPISLKRIRGVVIGRLSPQPANWSRSPLNATKNYGPAVGRPALDFTADTLDGNLVTLSDYIGKAVALVLVLPGSPESREVILAYTAAEAQIKATGKEIVVVSLGEDDETHQWAKELDVKFPVIIAPERTNSFKRDYHIPGLPFFCVLNVDGRVQAQGYASTDYSPLMLEF